MNWILLFLAAGMAFAAGCVSKSKARADALSAYQRGLLEAQQQSSRTNPPPVVLVRGDVRQQVLHWNAELSLSRALVAAEYRGLTTPRQIIVVRNGESYPIDPKRLLRGVEDHLLQPGDIIEIRR